MTETSSSSSFEDSDIPESDTDLSESLLEDLEESDSDEELDTDTEDSEPGEDKQDIEGDIDDLSSDEDSQNTDTSWYDISQERYKNNEKIDEISAGCELDMRYVPGQEATGDLKYKNVPIENLKKLLVEDPQRYKRCRIHLDGPHRAVCKVLEDGQTLEEIEIHGRGNCGQTFNEDEVVVEILDKGEDVTPSDENITFGKVIGVIESSFRDKTFPILACTANRTESYMMNPICKTVPKIKIWKGLSKKLFSEERYRIDQYKVGHDKQLKYIDYFDIPPGKSGQYVFLVVYLSWDPKHYYPQGAVVKILECGTDFESSVNILNDQFMIQQYYMPDTVNLVGKLLAGQDNRSTADHEDYRKFLIFTIDPEGSRDLDDALSVWKDGDNLKVGVHITDVASLVKKDDAVDKEARERATTFYERRKYHMLPEPLCEDKLSLLQGRDRFAISVLCTTDKKGNRIGDPQIKRTIIKVSKNLTYTDAQGIIDKTNSSNLWPQNLLSSVRTLHIIAKHWQKQRKKSSRFEALLIDPRFSKKKFPNIFDAKTLVEELMLMANSFIASWLMNTKNCPIPLRCQQQPRPEKITRWIENEGFIIDMILKLQDKVIQPNTTCKVDKQCQINLTDRTEYVIVQKSVWKDIMTAFTQKNFSRITHIMCCDRLHPRQILAVEHWEDIQEAAKYLSSSSPEKDLKHFSLGMGPYTHFTSPLRRYVDLVVHRQIHAMLDEQSPAYTRCEIEDLSKHVSTVCKRESAYERECKRIKKSVSLSKKPLTFSVIVNTVNENEARFYIPSLKGIPESSRMLPFRLLECCRRPERRGRDSVMCSWNKRLYKYESQAIRQQQEQNANANKETGNQNIDSTLHMDYIPAYNFAKSLKDVFSENDKRVPKAKRVSLASAFDSCILKDSGVGKLSSDDYGDKKIFHHCKFTLTFSPHQVLKVQMHARPDRGILTPYVQLFHVCENLSLCLTHTSDPVDTFAQYITKSIRNRKFSSVQEYQAAWLPIVEMETATSSVGSEATICIQNVNVKLLKVSNSIIGRAILDAKFCDVRQIEVGGKSIDRLQTMRPKEQIFEKLKRGSLDYLCLKYYPKGYDFYATFTTGSVWVGHAVVKKVKKALMTSASAGQKDKDDYGGPVILTFQLRPNSLQPPPHLLEHSFTAAVEIIVKSEVDRRTEDMLKVLDTEGSELAHSIALNDDMPSLDIPRYLLCKNSPTDLTDDERSQLGVRISANNDSQNTAIRNALVESFSLIQGPPGTGKTSTGVKLVFLFNKINEALVRDGFAVKKKQILFCGPSNKSIDLVAKYLKNMLGSLCPKIIRLYGKTVENLDFPVPKRDLISKRSMRGLTSDPDIRDVTAHFMVREENKTHAEALKEYDEKFKEYFKNPEKVEVTLGELKAYNSLLAKAEQEEIRKSDVILCTCAVSGSKKLTSVSRISQCIIDESAMCTEPLSMIPIIAAEPDQVVLLGDHRQLRPIIQCKEAAYLGLDQSLFERYSTKVKPLNTQYRMHKTICRFPARMFYSSLGLRTGPANASEARWYIRPGKELSIWPEGDNPKVFCHVEGQEETLTVATEEGNEQSKSNSMEADKVVEAFLYLIDKEKIPASEINLMTQYNAQKFIIQQKLIKRLKNNHKSAERSQLYKNISNVRIQTVVASQGGEWDYVILSTVRSLPRYRIEEKPTLGWCIHNLGFITDKNQINVALTRARKGLIIIGNSNLLKCDQVWRQLIQEYKDEECFVRGEEFPSQRRVPGIQVIYSR